MREIIELERQIADALPSASAAADQDAGLRAIVSAAHDILCNAWTTGEQSRLDRLRTIAAEIRRFAPQAAA